MKTNVSIKFNSIEEYREIERVLEELGYKNDKEWNEDMLKSTKPCYVTIFKCQNIFSIFDFTLTELEETYNSLEEFLKD